MPKKIIIFGAEYGGMVLTSSILRLLGVSLKGDKSSLELYESTNQDSEFVRVHKDKDWKEYAKLVKRRDNKYRKHWGYSYSGTKNDYEEISSLLGDDIKPIFIFRDPYAIAKQDYRFNSCNFESALSRAQSQNALLINLCRKLRKDCLVLSYEHIFMHPEKHIKKIANYLNIGGTRYNLTKVIDYVSKFNITTTKHLTVKEYEKTN